MNRGTTHPDGISQCQSNGQWQTFGHGDHEDGNSDDKELDEVLNVNGIPWQLLDDKLLDAEAQDQYQDCQNGNHSSCDEMKRSTPSIHQYQSNYEEFNRINQFNQISV